MMKKRKSKNKKKLINLSKISNTTSFKLETLVEREGMSKISILDLFQEGHLR